MRGAADDDGRAAGGLARDGPRADIDLDRRADQARAAEVTAGQPFDDVQLDARPRQRTVQPGGLDVAEGI